MITFLRTAVQTTVQDLGRRGRRHLGASTAGAMDPLALVIGNSLVGNAHDAAGIELCLPPATIRFDADCHFALSGADCLARLDGQLLDGACAATAAAGSTLELSAAVRGARAYLCVAGGIDVPLVMGSRSTDLQTGLGGFHGRMIRRGDVLAVLPAASAHRTVARIARPEQSGPIRLIAGPEFAEFDSASQAALFESPWRISPQSNRMGFRLEGPPLARATGGELKSHAVFPGVIQVPPGGAPIVLMADAHATGGYPRIAAVIAADQGRLAQVAPGGAVQFAACTRAAAMQAWRQQQAYVQTLRSRDHAH